MRTLLAGERTTTAAAAVVHWLKVEVQDADLAWKDLTNLAGVDWVISAEWGEDRDTPVSDCSVALRRSVGSTGGTSSLAPLLQSSTLNRNAAAAYAPLLELGRGLRISTATMLPGVTPASTDYRMGFEGRIDGLSWESDPVQVKASGMDAWLADTQIELKRQYAAAGGTPVETVMQSLLTDNYPGTIPTLYTPTSPAWNILTYTQDRVKLMEALRALALQIGWDLRYRYDASHVNRLTFYDPLRSRVTVDATIGPTEYLTVDQVDIELAEVRNAGVAPYRDTSGVRQTVSQQDNASISKYKRRYFELDESVNIKDPVNAQKLIDAATSDMSSPALEQSITMLFAWWVQLYDRYTFTANGDHYDTDQTLAVSGYRHKFQGGYGVTTLHTNGKVVGAYREWQQRVVNVDQAALPVISSVDVTFPDATHVEVTAIADSNAQSYRVAVSATGAPSLAAVQAAAPVNATTLLDTILALTVAVGSACYVGVIAYTGTGGVGNASSMVSKVVTRTGTGLANIPVAGLSVAAESDADITLILSGTGTGTLQYSTRIDNGVWSAFSTTHPNWVINKLPKRVQTAQLQVQQADGQVSVVATYTVLGVLGGLDTGTGKVDPSQPLAGTALYIPRATDVNGMILSSGTQDSRTALLNGMFRAGTDTAASVVEVAGQKFIHGSYIDSSRRPITVYDPTLAQDVGGNNINVAQLRARTALNSSNRLATGVEKTADVGGLSAHLVSRSQPGGVFRESFEEAPSTWPTRGGGGTFTMTTGLGMAGGNVGVMTGTNLRTGPVNVPFDPSKLHRIRFRVQQASISTTIPSSDVCYLGLVCYAADGVTQVDNANGTTATGHYLAAAGIHLGATAPVGTWQEYTGFFKGTAPTGPWGAVSPNADNPAKLAPNTRYIRPYLIGNYTGVSDGVVYVDEVVIDVLEESGTTAVWTTLDRTTPGRLLTAAADSRGSVINTHFRYGTDGAAGVVESATQKFVNGNALDGSRQVDFGAAGVVNRLAANVSRIAGGASVQAVIAQLTDLGHAGSTMQDSRTALLNGMFRAGTDTADSVLDGTGSPLAGGKRGFATIDSANRVIRTNGFSDGFYAAAATNTTGLALHSSVVDSRAALLNVMFRAGTDNLGSVLDGGGYSRVQAADVTSNRVATVTVPDTRSVNTVPSGYSLGVINEFKDASVIGIPGAVASTFGNLRTEKPWSDSSGGNITQTFAYSNDNRVWKRTAAAGATSWTGSTWRIVTESQTQRIDRDTGHADTTMQDSRGAFLNTMGRANVDLISLWVDGGGYAKVASSNVDASGNVIGAAVSLSSVVGTANLSTNQLTVTFTATGFPSGTTFNVNYSIDATTTGNGSSGGLDSTTSGHVFSIGNFPSSTPSGTITVDAINNGRVIATKKKSGPFAF